MSIVESVETPERPEVFRGHLDECLRHLSKCLSAQFPPGLKGAEKARQPIADFCDVHVSTVKYWLDKGAAILKGDFKLRLMCCLDVLGYRVIELEKTRSLRELAEVIGYRVMTGQEVSIALGYANNDEVLRLLKTGKRVMPDRRERILILCSEKRDELSRRKQAALESCRLEFSLTDSVRQRKVSAVTCIMEGLLAMLQSQEIGEPFTKSLADMAPGDRHTVLELSDCLHTLSVKIAQQNQKKEVE